jgi:hypothetical protein
MAIDATMANNEHNVRRDMTRLRDITPGADFT